MTALLQKMRIKAPHTLCAINASDDFEKTLSPLPGGVTITTDTKKQCDSLHWFVKTAKEVSDQTPDILKLMKPGVVVWCYYPKGTSKIQTDLTRDKGWDELLKHQQIKWLSLISFNDTWSAFAFRLKTEKETQEAEQPAEREIHKYADSAAKTITLPADLADAFGNNRAAKEKFDALSFSNRREYVEWVVTAKREETRTTRIAGTMEKLLAGKKNPAEK